jgi:uncharacterized membrane protein YfhO
MKALTLIFLLVFIAMFIIVAAWLLAGLKARSFNNECIYLDQLIKRSDITPEAYDDITNSLNDLEPYSDLDKKRKKSLWSGFMYKFRDISKYKI